MAMRAPGSGAPDAQRAPMLVLDDVTFGYGSKRILDRVSFSVQRGTCTCLMGVNGCGKSTLLDAILGEHRIESGSITVNGIETSRLKPARLAQLLAYVPQVHRRSFPYTVEHVVFMGRAAHTPGIGFGQPTEADDEIVREALVTCGVEGLATRPYTSLSGGEMQMVMLARALAQQTPLVIMDEPTAHLDFRNELVFLETIERLVVEQGVTVLMATHSPNQAFHLAGSGVSTRVALMHEGRIQNEGAPRIVINEKSLREVFGVEAFMLTRDIGEDEREVRQIVPRRTLRR